MPFKGDSLRQKIPGVTGRSIPGTAQMPRMVGGHLTSVPRIEGSSSRFREYHRQQIRDVQGRFAGGWGFAWQGLSMIDTNIYKNDEAIQNSLEEGMKELAERMLAWAQENAPWTDYPGDPPREGRPTESARANLQAVVVKESEDRFSIYIGHGKNVYYGVWLEVRWGGKFAIILPTVYQFGPQLGGIVKART